MSAACVKLVRWFVLLSIYNLQSFASAQGHFEEFKYTVRTYVNRCVPYSYQSCSSSGNWFRKRTTCRTNWAQHCADVLETQERTSSRCQAGWQPEGSCNIPICTPACPNGQVCKAPPQTCECLASAGGACTNVACSSTLDCYPGTCAANSASCNCPPGFSGNNCQTLLLKPTLAGCMTKIYGGSPAAEKVVAQSDCAAESLVPTVVWLATSTPTRIEVIYTAQFNSPSTMPRVNYVKNSPIPLGVTVATFNIQFPTAPYAATTKCSNVWDSPNNYVSCDMNVQWTNIGVSIQHNDTFLVTASAQSGGQKTGDSTVANGNFATIQILGSTSTRQTRFGVDLKPPTHCLLGSSTDNCTCFPIYLDQDIRTNEVIEPLMCGWTDDGAGISYFHVEVYYLQSGYDGYLAETGPAIYTEDIHPPYNNFRFTCQTSGVYSIQLTVNDRANNTAKARKLFNYDGESKLTVNNVDVYVAEAEETTGRRWINNLPTPRLGLNYTLTVIWKGRYQSDARYASGWLKAAKAWAPAGAPCTATYNCIDDTYKRFGLRTVDAMKNNTGLIGFDVAFEVDHSGGIGLTNPPTGSIYVPPTQEQQTINIAADVLQDGDTVVIWLAVSDVAGNNDQVRTTVSIDRTRAQVSSDEFKTKTVDEFTTSFYVTVVDRESGLKSISYSIYDKTLKTTVYTRSQGPQTLLQAAQNKTKRAADQQCPPGGDSTCYCVPTGNCYLIVQAVDIDNCVFDRYTKDPLEIQYTITNQAGLNTSGTLQLGLLPGIKCRPEDTVWTAGAIAGITVGIVVPTILLIVIIGLMIWRWRVHRDPLPASARRFVNRTFHKNRDATNVMYAASPRIVTTHENPYVKAEHPNNTGHDELYYTSGVNANRAFGIRLQPNQVEVDRRLAALAEGHFAIVRRGTVTVGNEHFPVAVKALKRGFTADNRRLMVEKINTLESIAPHVNVVKLIGWFETDNEGPVMCLELCDMTLTDWLKESKNATVDVLENIISFASDVAHGVQYLHSRHIIHRHLGVRNVLLKHEINGYLAKLIGFGITANDSGRKAVLPIRWLAPETLDTMESENPTFNEKTDVWTFGIIVWEMYSKGAKPYPNHSSHEVKGLIRRGYQLSCPLDCPPDLFQSVVVPCWQSKPADRPDFNGICTTIAEFRSSAGRERDELYYTAGQYGGGQYSAGQKAAATGAYDDLYTDAQ